MNNFAYTPCFIIASALKAKASAWCEAMKKIIPPDN